MRPEYFQLFELVPHAQWSRTAHSTLWKLFDDRVLITLDALRKRHGRMTMNDYHWGGHNEFRGWRPLDCAIGSTLSQHKFGRAADATFGDTGVEEVRQDILANKGKDDFSRYITRIEIGIPWLHFDVCNTDVNYVIQLPVPK